MFSKNDEEVILAEHGRWIAKLRDLTRLTEQRICMLERRVSALEGHFAELSKFSYKLDPRLGSALDQLTLLSSKVDALAENLAGFSRAKRGRRCHEL